MSPTFLRLICLILREFTGESTLAVTDHAEPSANAAKDAGHWKGRCRGCWHLQRTLDGEPLTCTLHKTLGATEDDGSYSGHWTLRRLPHRMLVITRTLDAQGTLQRTLDAAEGAAELAGRCPGCWTLPKTQDAARNCMIRCWDRDWMSDKAARSIGYRTSKQDAGRCT